MPIFIADAIRHSGIAAPKVFAYCSMYACKLVNYLGCLLLATPHLGVEVIRNQVEKDLEFKRMSFR